MAALTITTGTDALPTSTLLANITNVAAYHGYLYLPSWYGDVTGSMIPGTVADAAITLPVLGASGAMQLVELPALTGSGDILPGNVTRQSQAAHLLPPLSAAAEMLGGRLFDGAAMLPALALEAAFGTDGNIVLPKLTSSGLIVAGQALASAARLPALGATGSAYSHGLASGAVTLPRLTLTSDVWTGGGYTASALLPRLALAAEGYSGTVATGAIVLPVFGLAGESYGEYLGQAAIELPMLLLAATTAERTTTNSTAFAMNAKHAGLTEYTNFAFNSAANFNGAVLVANASGIFALGGDVDNAAIIDAYARMGISDFGTLAHKRVDMAYLGYRSNGMLRLTVITDEQESYDYALATRDGNSLHGNRTKLGRGMRGTYWQPEVGNVGGSDFEIDTLQLMAQPLSRKV